MLLKLFKKVIRKSTSFIFDKRGTIIYAIDLTSDCVRHVNLPKRGNWSIIVYDNISATTDNIKMQIKRAGQFDISEMEDRFSDGNTCFLVMNSNGQVLNYSWVCYQVRDIECVEKIIKLKDWEAFIFNCYTFKEYRGLSIYPWTLVEMQTHLKSRGYKKVYVDSSPKNKPSVKGIEKAGFIPEKKVGLLKILKYIRIRSEEAIVAKR